LKIYVFDKRYFVSQPKRNGKDTGEGRNPRVGKGADFSSLKIKKPVALSPSRQVSYSVYRFSPTTKSFKSFQ
jgi:hypothetical protein